MARDDRRQGAEDRAAPPDLYRRSRPRLRADGSALAAVATWTLTVRTGPRVERQRFGALEPALDALGTRVAEFVEAATARPPDTKLRRYGPEQQVVARIEVAGPQRRLSDVHAGIDVRGDGSIVAYEGRLRRRALDTAGDVDAVLAIRRALTQH